MARGATSVLPGGQGDARGELASRSRPLARGGPGPAAVRVRESMEAGKASRSTMGSALLSAALVREDPPPWVLEDTLAGQLLDAAEVAELEATMAAWPPAVRLAFR